METLISYRILLRRSLSSFSPRSTSIGCPSLILLTRQNYGMKAKLFSLSCSNFVSPDLDFSIYGGWEELDLMEDTGDSGLLELLRNFANYIGIDDKKLALPFLFGFFMALTASRVRFSTIAILPVSILVYLVGVFVGMAQQGSAAKKTESIGGGLGIEERLKQLEGSFSDVDGKILSLRKDLVEGVNADDLGMGFNDNYVQIVEHVRADIGVAQRTLVDCFSSDRFKGLIDIDNSKKKSNQKASSKRMELQHCGIDIFHFLNGMFCQSLIESKTTVTTNESIKERPNGRLSFASERKMLSEIRFMEFSRLQFSNLNQENSEVKEHGAWPDASILNGSKCKLKVQSFSDMFSFDEENNRGNFRDLVYENNHERFTFNSGLHDSDHMILERRKERHFSREFEPFLHGSLEAKNRDDEHSRKTETIKQKQDQMNGSELKENSANLQNNSRNCNQRLMNSNGNSKIPLNFEHIIMESTSLMKCAKEYMMSQAGEEQADTILYKAADLLSDAILMRPMSSVAMGKLGNTYLLHGELKLKLSRKLRTYLSSDKSFRFKKNESIAANKEDFACFLVSVCEECEGLLVEAGRKYRGVLSIDANDVRALYNWGLSLCFRAQLIADIGPETAMAADKMYMSAIDKFNAMLESNAFAPDALYGRGVALQWRSHLRRNNSREKSKLLLQAKSLFEEVLSMDSDNQLVRRALISCISELKEDQLGASG